MTSAAATLAAAEQTVPAGAPGTRRRARARCQPPSDALQPAGGTARMAPSPVADAGHSSKDSQCPKLSLPACAWRPMR